MARLPKHVECVAYRVRSGRYRALCLDFSLVAESTQSMLDAQNRLELQIQDYVQDVIAEGVPPHLVNRGLSWAERLPLLLRLLGSSLQGALVPILPAARPRSTLAVWQEPVASLL
jgi:hypothetical protein